MTIDDICGIRINNEKIRNQRLKQIIDSCRARNEFLHRGYSGSEEHNDRHTEKGGGTIVTGAQSASGGHSEYSDWNHTEKHDDHDEYSEYSDHVDHTEYPHSDYSQYSEGKYHTDSTSPDFKR